MRCVERGTFETSVQVLERRNEAEALGRHRFLREPEVRYPRRADEWNGRLLAPHHVGFLEATMGAFETCAHS